MRYNLKIEELTDEQMKNFVLCYVETIPHTYNDYDEDTQAMIESPEYKEYQAKKKLWYDEYWKIYKSMSSDTMSQWDRDNGYHWRYDYKDYPTPEYLEGYTHYLYFTDNMDEQWGDDWDDAPYEYNAEIPYDDDTNIIRIPVSIDYIKCIEILNREYDEIKDFEQYDNDYRNLEVFDIQETNCQYADIKFPDDYGNGNSPFSVDIINAKAVPWIWFNMWKRKRVQNAVAIFGGDTIEEVLNKINKINLLFNTKHNKE